MVVTVEAPVCHRPGGVLAGYVRDFVAYRETSPVIIRRAEYASSRVTVLIGGADPIMIPGRPGGVAAVIAGPRTAPAETAAGGRQEGIALTLSPLDAYATFGLPMHQLTDRFLALDDVLGADGHRLTEQVARARSVPDRLALVAAALTRLRAAGPTPDPALAEAWRRLRDPGRRTMISELAQDLGCTRRHLSRRFAEQIGLSPRSAALVLRFERAARLLGRGDQSLADIAAVTGYADQAHLTRDVRAFTGRTPTRFARDHRTAFTDFLTS